MTETTRDVEGTIEDRLDAHLERPEPGIIQYHGMTMWIEEAAAEIRRLRSELERRDAALREWLHQYDRWLPAHAAVKIRALATGGDDE